MKWQRWIILFMALFAFPLNAETPQTFDYHDFAQIPVLQDGRIKPLDSFARVMLSRISGTSSLPDMPAIEWLAGALFAPSAAAEEKIFIVHASEIMRTLALPSTPDNRYSFNELAASFSTHPSAIASLAGKSKGSYTAPEQELATLYENFNEYADLTGSFSLLLPIQDIPSQIKQSLKLADNISPAYMDLLRIRRDIEQQARDIMHHPHHTETELRIARLNANLMLMEALNKDNRLLRVIPAFWEGSDEWLSPWAMISKGMGSPQGMELFHNWQKLGEAFRQGDAAVWKSSAHSLLALGVQHDTRTWAIALEVTYNSLNLLNIALIAYGLGLAFALVNLLNRFGSWNGAAYGTIFIGMLLHGTAIAMRMAILMRPPVSTLYESMIFVSFVTAVAGLWIARGKKETDGLIISSSVAALLLAAANVFAGGNDTLEVLVAVLNTNFWLATHVVCITTGYGSCLVAGTLAHLYLFKCAFGTQEEVLTALRRRIHLVGLIALLFTAVGTMLGGIWADQSWGRFWGWDPKENGALWIVLWLIWLLHGRIAGQLRPLGFAIGMALINVVVALAWVGVNLLSVGLHSYGFTNTAADGLIAFCAFEFGFVILMACIINCRRHLLKD